MGKNIYYSVKFLPNLFQQKYQLDCSRSFRQRIFNGQTFFFSLLSLVAGCNNEGYLHALTKVFSLGLNRRAPTAAALCKFRNKIHYKFFKDCLENLLEKTDDCVATLGGLRVYAVDGQQWILNRTKDIVANGFNGRPTGDYLETYLPRGYLTHLYDVITGVTKQFTFNPTLNELADARKLLSFVEKKSLIIYDRLFFSYRLMNLHFEKGNYFLIRCKRKANVEVDKLYNKKSKKKGSFKLGNKRIYLFKVKNPRNSEWIVFATNLPKSWRQHQLVSKLYKSRWEVESSFKELTGTTKGEQWHSKSYNGMMQELYAKFWLINFTKISMLLAGQKPRHPLEEEYEKANFKLVFNYIDQVLVKIYQELPSVETATNQETIAVFLRFSMEKMYRKSFKPVQIDQYHRQKPLIL